MREQQAGGAGADDGDLGAQQGHERRDKWIAGGLVAWSLAWFGVVVIGSIWNLIAPWPLAVWAAFWHVAGLWVPLAVVAVTGVWFTVGGVRDIRDFFARMKTRVVNPLDNGMVAEHRNRDEAR